MYVCMDARMDGWLDGRTDGLRMEDGWMEDGWMGCPEIMPECSLSP